MKRLLPLLLLAALVMAGCTSPTEATDEPPAKRGSRSIHGTVNVVDAAPANESSHTNTTNQTG